MKPEDTSFQVLGITQSKAKMYEYDVPLEFHIEIPQNPNQLFTLTIGLLGDIAAQICTANPDETKIQSLKENLTFSARFFDSYLQSRLNSDIDQYLLILGSAAYYLCDLPGSSKLLIERADIAFADAEGLGLENLLAWILRSDFRNGVGNNISAKYREKVFEVKLWLQRYFETGTGKDSYTKIADNFRRIVYDTGTARQLLYVDIIFAVIKRKIENSTWFTLPRYSELNVNKWSQTLRKENFIQEMWPAQQLIGKQGVFRGKSAIIQMPTSAGKTRAIEIIVRSAFLSNRTSLAIIVAPFRALCHEIREDFVNAFRGEQVFIDELSDTPQVDFNINSFLLGKQILIVTPEKLNYMIRHTPEIAETIGLLVYDEGHQFDNGTRGITYELLVTSLKSLVPKDAQIVLISAVVRNAESLGGWLKKESQIVLGMKLLPTFKSIVFASWVDVLGRLWFVNSENIEKQDYFVPRVIHQVDLQRRPREKKTRVFPTKGSGQEVALYLGLKLVKNGSVAIFCGTKTMATNLCEKVVEIFDRGLDSAKPNEVSDQSEINQLVNLHRQNMGQDAIISKSAQMGIFAHHGNIPHGLRIAIEFAMKKAKVKFVICTSTLAQGVNLPIRYLLVTGVNQGGERIGVRDFQNLIGRSGRSGMHTEGSIIFADTDVYDNRGKQDRWRWEQTKELLGSENSEPVTSTLFSFFDPLLSDDRNLKVQFESSEIIQAYIAGVEGITYLLNQTVNDITELYPEYPITINGLRRQFDKKINILVAIESFLLSHWKEIGDEVDGEKIVELAKQTLAYYLADEEQKPKIEELFRLLGDNIIGNVPEPARKLAFGRTLFGVQSSIAIETWASQNANNLFEIATDADLLILLWPILNSNISNAMFRSCDNPEALIAIATAWMNGDSFELLYKILIDSGAQIIRGKTKWSFKIENVVDLCENAISYEGSLVIAAIVEFVNLSANPNSTNVILTLQNVQKRIKYGLPTAMAIALYELGFSDRVIAIGLTTLLEDVEVEKGKIIQELKLRRDQILQFLKQYPSYFSEVFMNLTT